MNIGPEQKKGSHLLNGNEWLYLLFCFLVYFSWSAIFPLDSYGPDEYSRIAIPQYIYNTGTLPCGWEEELRNPIWGFSYGFSLTAPYLLSAFFMWIVSFITEDPQMLVIAARFTSVLSMTGVCWFSIRLARRITAGPIRWVFTVLMTLTPQIVFLSSYVNLEAFTLLGVMVILDSWFEGLSSDWSIRSCVELAFGIGICFLGYEYAWGYILSSFCLFCCWFLHRRHTIPFSVFFRKGMTVFAVVLLLAGWRFIRNAILYNGDFIGLSTREHYGELYAMEPYKPSMRITYRNQGKSIAAMLNETEWIRLSWHSMFSVLGYMNVYAQNWVYQGYNIILSFAIAGAASIIRHKKMLPVLAAGLLSAILTVGISVYYSWSVDYQPQGRYVIYILPVLLLLSTCGFKAIMDWVENAGFSIKIQRKTIEIIVAALVTAFVLCALSEAFLHLTQVFEVSWALPYRPDDLSFCIYGVPLTIFLARYLFSSFKTV